MIERRSLHPVLLVALATLLLLAARIAGAQQTNGANAASAALPLAPRAAISPVRIQPAEPIHRLPIALRAIPRGAVLTADDFEYRDTTSRITPDTVRIVPGWVARRTINQGEILHEPAIEPPAIVTANEPVQVEWMDHDVRLTVRGIAARSGALGERVPVRTELGKRVEGTVVAPGRVRID